MHQLSTDKDWEYFGKNDPYYGVFSNEKFRVGNYEGHKDDFFRSGEEWVAHVCKKIEQVTGSAFKPTKVLDFGCGVGRVLIPLARRFESAVGLDVSDSYLRLCQENLKATGLAHVVLRKSDDNLTEIQNQKFDLIHSCHVLQHISVKRGLKIFSKILDSLHPAGIGVVHFPFSRNRSFFRKLMNHLRKYAPVTNYILNVFYGRKFFEPVMQMNTYPLEKIIQILMCNQISKVYCEFDEESSGYVSVVLYFQK
jgi:cyclopropane fatty-acyl-phospholipid synthase-like methyltransferase